jgi:hypothetical protein
MGAACRHRPRTLRSPRPATSCGSCGAAGKGRGKRGRGGGDYNGCDIFAVHVRPVLIDEVMVRGNNWQKRVGFAFSPATFARARQQSTQQAERIFTRAKGEI